MRKGFTLVETIVTLVIAGIFLAMTIGILISTTNLSAHAERNMSAKQITTEILEFMVEQTKYATEITPVASNTAVSAGAYTIPTSDKIRNEKWLPFDSSNPWHEHSPVGISMPNNYDDDYSYEEKLKFYDDELTPAQQLAISTESYKRNLIFYVGDASGVPAKKGYLYFKRADDDGSPLNVFGITYYKKMKISLDVSETIDPVSSRIVVTETITLWYNETNWADSTADKKIRTIQNSFELVNIDADADGDKFNDWEEDDDITIIGADDPPHYYICKDVKYFDW
jgi:prepilin-type N-terminal cleavage/methylation domain-containing protein